MDKLQDSALGVVLVHTSMMHTSGAYHRRATRAVHIKGLAAPGQANHVVALGRRLDPGRADQGLHLATQQDVQASQLSSARGQEAEGVCGPRAALLYCGQALGRGREVLLQRR